MKKIGFLCLAKYPVPAVKGGAVETLVTNLLDENEAAHMLDMVVFSFSDGEAIAKSLAYKHSQFFFISKSIVAKIINRIVQKSMRLLGKNESLCYYMLRKKIARVNLDGLVLEASAGYAQRLHHDFPNVPLYFHVHNIPEGEFCRNFKSLIDGCLCISKFIMDETIKLLGLDVKKMHLLYNSVDTRLFTPVSSSIQKEKLRRERGFSADDKVVVFTGRLQEFKGIKQLLEAFVRIKDEKVKLLVVGASFFSESKSTPFIDKLKSIAEGYEKRIIFTGFVNHGEIFKYYQISDIAVLPSMWEEPFGLTCLEALACGLPVITTKSGGLPEIITDKCGFLVERDACIVSHIHEKIEYILSNDSLRSSMSHCARERSLKFDSKDYLKNFVNIITNNKVL